jgi:hypothetical protein
MSEQAIPSTPALTGTDANVAMEVGDAAAARAQATVLVAAIQQRDAWITAAEQDLAERDSILSGLERHPTLWLILGREGIDRPGSVWSTTTGQQVVTRTRIAYRVVGLVALLMLLVGLGVGWGVGTGWDVSGMVDLINDMR